MSSKCRKIRRQLTLELLETRTVPAALPTGLDISALSGGNGFAVNGPSKFANLGRSTAGIGDVNGDGLADVAYGGAFALGGDISRGQVVVVFGRTSAFSTNLDVSELDGANGFVVNGEANYDQAGSSVASAGDINGDGVGDLMIGAPESEGSGVNRGRAYVVFGTSTGFPASLDLSALNGNNGFILNGVADGDRVGKSVAGIGDVNGDGRDDLLIGTPYAGSTGRAYVVFGSSTGFGASFDLSNLNGTNGFVLNGISSSDRTGAAVARAGDVNDDGINDLIVGAPGPQLFSMFGGRAYVVFGSSTAFSASLDFSSLNGSNGFTLNGEVSSDQAGYSVAGAADVNGDGIDDLIIGARGANADLPDSGRAYVVFGSSGGFSANLDLSALNGTNGFKLNGEAGNDQAGSAVAGAGDVNGDSIADLIVSAPQAEAGGNARGRVYVIFGRTTAFAATQDLSALSGPIGFVVNGGSDDDRIGQSVAGAGDVNGDGLADVLVGAPTASGGGTFRGEGYVVFGRTYHLIATGPDAVSAPLVRAFSASGRPLFEFLALPSNFTGGVRVAVGDVNGDGMPDIITGSGAGMAAQVQLFDGWTGKPLTTGFRPYGVGFTNGVYVAAANVTGNGRLEIIVGPGKGPRPVKVFDVFGNTLSSFFPYGAGFAGGVRVAAGDVVPGGFAEIVTGRSSGASQVKAFTSAGVQQGPTIKAFSTAGGNFVAVGDVDGDGQQEIVVGAEGLQPPKVRWFNPATGAQEGQLTAYTPNSFHGGVRVGVLPGLTGPNRSAILTAPGKGKAAEIKRFDALNPVAAIDSFFAYDQDFTGGAFVAGV